MDKENQENYCIIYLVRHGETEWNVKKITQGQSESYLTEKGVEQAKETAEKLKDVKFDAIFSSDLNRTYKEFSSGNRSHAKKRLASRFF
jgi:alpha-ribazole phosphatase